MTLDIQPHSTETILQRIDTIIRELETLRQIVLANKLVPHVDNPAQKLFGVLGRGSWDEYDPSFSCNAEMWLL